MIGVSDDPAAEIELVTLFEAIQRRWGIDLRGWAAAPVRARLMASMARRGLASLSELQGWLLRDRAALEALVAEVWSRPSRGMFAEVAFWRGLRETVLPALRSWPVIRVWVAGCGSGEEVWSLAVLLDEEGLGARARLHATDPAEAALVRAREGVAPAAVVAAWSEAHRQAGGGGLAAYFALEGERARLSPALLGRIAWARHLPGVDAAFNEFCLILFRNPFVWTGTAARRQVAALLGESQARFGFLCVDAAATLEVLAGAGAASPGGARWQLIDPALAIARRVK